MNEQNPSQTSNLNDGQNNQANEYGSAERYDGKEELETPKKESKATLIILVVFLIIVIGIAVAYYFLVYTKEPTVQITACNYQGVAYNQGSTFDAPDGCNTCTCRNGEMECTEMDCQGDTEITTTTTPISTEDWQSENATIVIDNNQVMKTYKLSFELPNDQDINFTENEASVLIQTEDIVMEVKPSLDDANTSYENKREYEVIDNLNLDTGKGTFAYRVRSDDKLLFQSELNGEYSYFYYTHFYGEGTDCDMWTPEPVACGFSTTTVYQDDEIAGGLTILCGVSISSSESVALCDSIVREMDVDITNK